MRSSGLGVTVEIRPLSAMERKVPPPSRSMASRSQ